MASAMSNLISQLFPNSIAEKLDDSNYLHWRQHVEPVIKSHKLQRFVVSPIVPPRYLIEDDRITDCVNPEYGIW